MILALKNGVGLDGKNNVKVTRWSATCSRLPLADGAEAGTGVDPCRNLEFDPSVLLHPALAMAGFARVLDRLSRTSAFGARLGDGKEPPTDGDLSLTAACGTGGGFGAGSGT